MNFVPTGDVDFDKVHAAILEWDPDGNRIARVLRDTLDQLYDGQRTGRYKLEQLFKTEKTHCGTLVEINLRREFAKEFQDGIKLDYRILDVEVDCKYSQEPFGWMFPPEALGEICLIVWADDPSSQWKVGLFRPELALLNAPNRDKKRGISARGRSAISWIFSNASLPPNVLLQLDERIVQKIMDPSKSGQQRINELFRNTLGKRVGRGVVATVAQQDDYMKRVRGNGGARSALKPEGIIILGQYKTHRQIARELGIPEPSRGESIPLRVIPAPKTAKSTSKIGDSYWKIAAPTDPIVPAPELPELKR